MKAPSLPSNWRGGFTYPHSIGAGGREEPFLCNGEWLIRCWNDEIRDHELYSYSRDVFEPEGGAVKGILQNS